MVKVEAVVIRERIEIVIDAVEEATGHVGVTVIEAVGHAFYDTFFRRCGELLAPVLIVMRFGVIGREERYLEARFGDAYRAYCSSVRRWI